MSRAFLTLITSFTAVLTIGGSASAQPYGDGPSSYAPASATVQVFSEDGWYPAQILEVSGYYYLVHYYGTDSYSDEWVDASRIRGLGPAPITVYEPAVQVYWGGRWYDGTAFELSGGRYHVRYRGVDEWVPHGRLRVHARGYAGHGWGRVHAGGGYHQRRGDHYRSGYGGRSDGGHWRDRHDGHRDGRGGNHDGRGGNHDRRGGHDGGRRH